MATRERLERWGEGTRGCEALEGSARPTKFALRQGSALGTLPGRQAPDSAREKISEKASVKCSEIGSPSSGPPVCRVRSASIRKKVMGHGTLILRRQFAGCRGFRFPGRPLGLLYQPARKHGLGTFVDPLVEKRGNLLSKIGGMSKAGELKALQRVARSREKELPRGLSSGARHRGPPG